MSPGLKIDPLAHHRDLIPVTVDWHIKAFDTSGDRDSWLSARTQEARSGGVPCARVAFLDDTPVGSVSLIASNMDTRPELTPWLAALFVLPQYRRRGVGTALCGDARPRRHTPDSRSSSCTPREQVATTGGSGGSRSARTCTKASGLP
jgi:GNAT superfamily N-acetyltransferase